MKIGMGIRVCKTGMILAAGLLCFAGQAQVATITHGSSSASVDLNSNDGMFEWNVGGMDRLVRQWFFYRTTGTTGLNYGIQNLGLVSYAVTGGNVLDVNYGTTGSPVEVRVRYELLSAGPGEGDIKEDIYVRNISGAAISGFRFFQYSDFNLTGGNDEVEILFDAGVIYAASQWNTTHYLSETVALPEPGKAQAGDATALYNALTTANGLELNNNAYYTGDAAWAFQWTYDLASGEDLAIIKDKYISVDPVPEPAALSLLLVGAFAFVARRKAC